MKSEGLARQFLRVLLYCRFAGEGNNLVTDEVAQAPRQEKIEREFS